MNMLQVYPKTIDKNEHDEYEFRAPLLTLRLITLMIVVVLLTLHVRSMRVFRWEHSVTGGILVTYTMSMLGLALCAGAQHCGGLALQSYLTGVGSVLMAVNAAVIWQRWHQAGELTRVVAELLATLGVRLKRQIITKVTLSAVASLALLVDLIATPFLLPK